MSEIKEIIEKGKKSLENGICLSEGLTRKEYILFLRNVPRPKINETFLPYIEIEAWTSYSVAIIKSLMAELNLSVHQQDHSWSTPAPVYPYTKWFLHGDSTISVNRQKLKKLLEEDNYPIQIKLKNVQHTDRLNDVENPNPFGTYGINEATYKKILGKIEEKQNELISTYQKIDSLIESFSGAGANNAKLYKLEPTVEYDCIEFSSPALKTFKDLRNIFYLFTTKGINKTPCLFVNKSCGLHISFLNPHKPSNNVSDTAPNNVRSKQYLKRLTTLFGILEQQVYKIVPDHRKTNSYCQQISRDGLDEDMLYSYASTKYASLNIGKNNNRFQEFRFINATSNVTQIENWILFLQNFCDYAYGDKEINADLHLFDVVTNPILQDWYIRRRAHLTSKAVEDKNTDSTDIEIFLNIKIKRDELEKAKSEQQLIEQPVQPSSEEQLNTAQTRTVNSPVNQRQPIPRPTRPTNLQASRRRIRDRRN